MRLGWLFLWLVSFCAQALTVTVEDTEIPVQVISPQKDPPVARLLWLPSEYGRLLQEESIARRLTQQGVESWLPELFEPYFLSPSPSSVRDIPAEAVIKLFARAREDGMPVYLVGANRGALLALGAWQGVQATAPVLHAAILLMNPNLYVATPKPGQEAVYWPETERLNAPVYLLQAELSPWRWRLKTLVERLSQGGSDVFVHLLPKVRDRFYFRPDALPVEQQAAQRFPPCVHEMPSMVALKSHFIAAPFEILAINLAEEKPAIEAFLREHPVNFPILLDPAGQAVKSWRVFAYPSSYLLDKQGRIRYAAFGALDWNAEEVRALILRLIEE